MTQLNFDNGLSHDLVSCQFDEKDSRPNLSSYMEDHIVEDHDNIFNTNKTCKSFKVNPSKIKVVNATGEMSVKALEKQPETVLGVEPVWGGTGTESLCNSRVDCGVVLGFESLGHSRVGCRMVPHIENLGCSRVGCGVVPVIVNPKDSRVDCGVELSSNESKDSRVDCTSILSINISVKLDYVADRPLKYGQEMSINVS